MKYLLFWLNFFYFQQLFRLLRVSLFPSKRDSCKGNHKVTIYLRILNCIAFNLVDVRITLFHLNLNNYDNSKSHTKFSKWLKILQFILIGLYIHTEFEKKIFENKFRIYRLNFLSVVRQLSKYMFVDFFRILCIYIRKKSIEVKFSL